MMEQSLGSPDNDTRSGDKGVCRLPGWAKFWRAHRALAAGREMPLLSGKMPALPHKGRPPGNITKRYVPRAAAKASDDMVMLLGIGLAVLERH